MDVVVVVRERRVLKGIGRNVTKYKVKKQQAKMPTEYCLCYFLLSYILYALI